MSIKKMKANIGNAILLVAIVGILAVASIFAFGAQSNVPSGPDTLTVFNTSRYNNANQNGTSLQVEAGNVTGLSISETTLTAGWAGYFGNVSGTIALADAGGNTFYNWQIVDPSGEVYASNISGVTWSLVGCFNLSFGNSSMDYPMNYSTLEKFFGMNKTDLDGFNETFTSTFIDTTGFYVGSIRIDQADQCAMAFTYANGSAQSENFKEVLLTDNSSIIFTALINKSVDNYRSGTELSDFQMLVAEDGHLGQEAGLTTYYFFVELG